MRAVTLETPRGTFAALRNDRGGAPLLALHGWLDNAASFLPMAPHLDAFDLVALDLPGHGQSFHYPAQAEYSLFSTLLDVLAAADALGFERFALLGHSMGGAISSLVAAAAPERIASLHLIEALGPLAAPEEGTGQRLRDAVAQRRALEGKRKRVFDDPALAERARMQTPIAQLDAASAKLIVGRGLRAVEGGYEWSSDARLTLPTAVRMTEAQVRDCLAGIACPVRMVMADPPPPYIPTAMIEARRASVADVQCTVMVGGHHLHMTHPREVAQALGLLG